MFDDPRRVGCWPTLTTRLHGEGSIRRWALVEPGLCGYDSVEALLEAWADPRRTHQVGEALIRLAAADGESDDDALALLLHLLSGVVHRLAAQLRDLSPDVYEIVLSELTCQIRTYRWRNRPGGLVANLAWDTRRAVLADLRPSDRYHPERVERVTRNGDVPPVRDDGGTRMDESRIVDALDLCDLLRRGVAAGVPEPDLALLIAAETRTGRRGSGTAAAVARSFGVSRATLYRRRSRTLAVLRGIADEYQDAAA